jgi:hypothetical protein
MLLSLVVVKLTTVLPAKPLIWKQKAVRVYQEIAIPCRQTGVQQNASLTLDKPGPLLAIETTIIA